MTSPVIMLSGISGKGGQGSSQAQPQGGPSASGTGAAKDNKRASTGAESKGRKRRKTADREGSADGSGMQACLVSMWFTVTLLLHRCWPIAEISHVLAGGICADWTVAVISLLSAKDVSLYKESVITICSATVLCPACIALVQLGLILDCWKLDS